MVKYNHCEKCKRVYNTETWIGEVHVYNGICSSCIAEEQQENQIQHESVGDQIIDKDNIESTKRFKNSIESTQSSPIEIEKSLLSSLEQKANGVLSSGSSIDVLIKEIKDGLIDKARERIKETFQSFDATKIDYQKVVNYAENTLDYLSEYKEYMDNVLKKLQDKPKMKVKTAIEKVFKETIANMPKAMAKDVLLNKKTTVKNVFGKAVKWYNIYLDTNDVNELIKKMMLHPYNEIHKKLNTLPFYTPS